MHSLWVEPAVTCGCGTESSAVVGPPAQERMLPEPPWTKRPFSTLRVSKVMWLLPLPVVRVKLFWIVLLLTLNPVLPSPLRIVRS